jgi:hypothetical protein
MVLFGVANEGDAAIALMIIQLSSQQDTGADEKRP